MNGEPLPHWHGAPARLVVPGWTATYWAKHLTGIRIVPKAFDGFWMKNAYRLPLGAFPGARFTSQEDAATTPITEILVNSLITSHVSGARLPRGSTAEVRGWAWDGEAASPRWSIPPMAQDMAGRDSGADMGASPGVDFMLRSTRARPGRCRFRYAPRAATVPSNRPPHREPFRIPPQRAPYGEPGDRMNRRSRRAVSLLPLLCLASLAMAEDESSIVLADSPDREFTVARCAICHSLDYIPMNQPVMDRARWQATVRKMIDRFGAPLDEQSAARIVDYLSQNYVASPNRKCGQDHC